MILETANVEHLEFDGNTVLCRVCGDKASGFHYGVHACEGCKGFFRRSIQQKIQYRPCLKNQQCNIMRVNRNRCQYCRLKKCISVGMSRDAVRFGRVPKKEKAKIMEQMKRVNAQSQMNMVDSTLDQDPDFLTKIVRAHFQNCDFTREKLRDMCAKAYAKPDYISCPAHMACPLNPRAVDKAAGAAAGGSDKWQEFSEFFTPAIRNVVNFAKHLPGFDLFSQDDQVTLLKAGTFEVLLVHLAAMFDAARGTMMFADGRLYRRDQQPTASNAGFLLDSMFDFAARINQMALNDEEVALFSAAVIISADRPGIRNVEMVEKVQNKIQRGLQTMLGINHPDDPALFTKLIRKIPDLRTLNTLHSEKLLGTSVPQEAADVTPEASESPKQQAISPETNLRQNTDASALPGCPFPRNVGLMGAMPPFTGLLPFAAHLPPATLPFPPVGATSGAGFADLRRDMLEAAYSMYGRLPQAPALTQAPALPAGWSTIKQEPAKDIPPFWAQLAAANNSLLSADRKEVEDMYAQRRGSDASSIRSAHTPIQGRDDDVMLSGFPPRMRKHSVTATISKSPSLDTTVNIRTSTDSSVEEFKPLGHAEGKGHASPRSSPEPLDLDLPSRQEYRKLSMSLSPSPTPRMAPEGGECLSEQRRKRVLPGDRADLDPKMPRLAALWEHDMRSSRSNSISSSSSLESADSAYRTISNPGTPRSSLADPRSPYPQCTPGFRHRAFTEPKQTFSPFRTNALLPARDTKSISPSPLAMQGPRDDMRRALLGGVARDDDMRRSLLGGVAKKETSPVLKTALSMPPLLGQEAWFHTPRSSTFALPPNHSAVAPNHSAMARSLSQDTTASETIDVESIETDTHGNEPAKPSECPKTFKLKKSFLERFSPELSENKDVADHAIVDRLKRSTASPAGSLPEKSTECPIEVPKRSKTASPPRLDLSPISPPLSKDTQSGKQTDEQSDKYDIQIPHPVSQDRTDQSADSDSSRVHSSLMTSQPVHSAASMAPLMAAALGSQIVPPSALMGVHSPALLYQYAAMQQFHNMHMQQLQRSAEGKGKALDLVIKKEPQQ